MLYLLQPTVDYCGLEVTERRRITQAGYWLEGLCYSNGALYVGDRREVKSGGHSYSLAVYFVQSGDITLLDRLELGTGYWWPLSPRVDRHSRRVFVACGDSGVTVARLDGDRLVRERTLTCVRDAVSVDVMSADTAYVGDRDSHNVCVVDVRNDRITSTLETPDSVKGKTPYSLAVLGDSVMVRYGYPNTTLVVYSHGSHGLVRVIPNPGGLQFVSAVSTDCHSNFLVTDIRTESVFVMDASGNLRHSVNISAGSGPVDSAVVNRQLWAGCDNGNVVIMSSK